MTIFFVQSNNVSTKLHMAYSQCFYMSYRMFHESLKHVDYPPAGDGLWRDLPPSVQWRTNTTTRCNGNAMARGESREIKARRHDAAPRFVYGSADEPSTNQPTD